MAEFFAGYGLPIMSPKDIKRGESNSNAKLNETIVRQMRELYPQNTTREIADWLKDRGIIVSLACVNGVVKRYNWRHVK